MFVSVGKPSRPEILRAGFTLIEILVVIAVIAVLAALVAPNVFRHVGTAKSAAARSQIEQRKHRALARPCERS